MLVQDLLQQVFDCEGSLVLSSTYQRFSLYTVIVSIQAVPPLKLVAVFRSMHYTEPFDVSQDVHRPLSLQQHQ